jgi:hypothetical protein
VAATAAIKVENCADRHILHKGHCSGANYFSVRMNAHPVVARARDAVRSQIKLAPRGLPREHPCHAVCHAEIEGVRRTLKDWDGRPKCYFSERI